MVVASVWRPVRRSRTVPLRKLLFPTYTHRDLSALRTDQVLPQCSHPSSCTSCTFLYSLGQRTTTAGQRSKDWTALIGDVQLHRAGGHWQRLGEMKLLACTSRQAPPPSANSFLCTLHLWAGAAPLCGQQHPAASAWQFCHSRRRMQSQP